MSSSAQESAFNRMIQSQKNSEHPTGGDQIGSAGDHMHSHVGTMKEDLSARREEEGRGGHRCRLLTSKPSRCGDMTADCL